MSVYFPPRTPRANRRLLRYASLLTVLFFAQGAAFASPSPAKPENLGPRPVLSFTQPNTTDSALGNGADAQPVPTIFERQDKGWRIAPIHWSFGEGR